MDDWQIEQALRALAVCFVIGLVVGVVCIFIAKSNECEATWWCAGRWCHCV